MITVKELLEGIKEQEIPEDALCYGYEGEICGVVFRSADNKEQLGYVETGWQ